MKKLLVVCAALATVLSLAGCSTGSKRITEKELYGTWYAQNAGKYQTITFAEDGTYTTEDFLSKGTFQLAKDGTVKLVDEYRDVETLTPEHDENGWGLTYDTPYVPTLFTRDELLREDFVNHDIEDLTETQIWYMAAVDQILKGVPWQTHDGTTIMFSNNSMQIGDNKPVEYNFISAEGLGNGKYSFSFSNADGTYLGTLTEEVLESNLCRYEVSLKLNGDVVLSASAECEMIMLTQP